MFNRKAPATLAVQSAQVAERALSARSSFVATADDLERAARDHDLIAALAQEEIDHFLAVREDALTEANANRRAAGAIRALVGDV